MDSSSSRLHAWLQRSSLPPVAEEAQEAEFQPRYGEEAHSNGSVIEEQRVYHTEIDNRGSLEDILRCDSLSHEIFPEAIDLPESRIGSTATDDDVGLGELSNDRILDDQTSEASFDVINRLGAPLIPSAAELPPSPIDSETGQLTCSEIGQGSTQGEESEIASTRIRYTKILENAGQVLDHIRHGNVRARSRHDKASLIYVEYRVDQELLIRSVTDVGSMPSLVDFPDTERLLILVEDLSERVIHKLGEEFGINPEFFEEHLVNSGYSGANYEQTPAKLWKTASFEKSYISIKWYRPVWRTPTYFSSRDLSDLFRYQTEHFTYLGKITSQPMTNIFRSGWGLWTDPAKTTRVKREYGWEEQISIWTGKFPDQDCQVVIALLDPLPEIREQESFWRRNVVYETAGPLSRETSNDEHEEARVGTWGVNEDALPRGVNEKSFWYKIWARFVSRRIVGKDNFNITTYKCIIDQMAPRQEVKVDLDRIFRDQDPTMSLKAKMTHTKSTLHEIRETIYHGTGHFNLTQPLLQIIRQDTLTLLNQLRKILDEVDVEILDDVKMEDRLVLWRQLINRAQRELPEISESIRPFVTFLQKVDPPELRRGDQEHDLPPDLENLLKDINRMAERLRTTSASLASNMALLDSRRSIDEAHAVTRLTELAFIFIPLSFAASVFGMQIEPFANPVPVWYFFVVASVATSFSYLMRIVVRSQWFNAMKIEMKYEIRKYAEKHGKSVQPRSLSVRLILAWALTTTALNTVHLCKRTVEKSARSLWVASTWFYREMGFFVSFFLLIGLISGFPIGILWAKNVDSGIRTAVSIGIVFAVIATVGAPFWMRADPNALNAWPRFSTFSPSRLPRWIQRGLFLLISSATVILIPMTLIWTRPLDTGIKIGVTVGISVIAILALGAIAVVRFFARSRFNSRTASTSYQLNSD
ncbi:Mg2+ transporter protein CorA-like/Zinc transport protein ZntB [Penicillium sp. IBT 18751x]|nr:Mg2+ transporter protein CorA-like/Zinc transport protein ZntB [Penicillium sp. IBT 18751x]